MKIFASFSVENSETTIESRKELPVETKYGTAVNGTRSGVRPFFGLSNVSDGVSESSSPSLEPPVMSECAMNNSDMPVSFFRAERMNLSSFPARAVVMTNSFLFSSRTFTESNSGAVSVYSGSPGVT